MMLTEKEVREQSARASWVILPVMAGAVGMTFLYFVGMGYVREPLASLVAHRFGVTAGDIAGILLIFPAFPIFLVPSCLAAGYAGRFKTMCPFCNRDISSLKERIVLTRCCPVCGERVVAGGQTHSAAVYARYRARWSRQFLKCWLWAWPALGGLAMGWQLWDRSAFEQCPQCVWIGPLIGTATAGWAWLRTFDRRYLPQLLSSAALLGLGAAWLWQGP